MQGVDLDKDKEEVSDGSEPVRKKSKSKLKNQPLLFGDPAQYDKMSEQERQELTKKMMSKWGQWAGNSPLEATKKR